MQPSEGKKLVNTKGGFRMVVADENLRSPFELEEPRWQCDAEHTTCGNCGKRFSVMVRRHHCRRCGKIFCGQCCREKILLPRLAFIDPQRVCSQCTALAKKEKTFYEEHILSLQNGAELLVDDSSPLIFKCKLNPKTHREILFNCTSDKHIAAHEPVILADVISVQSLTDEAGHSSDAQGVSRIIGMILKYRKDNAIEEVKLQIPEGAADEKKTLVFFSLLQEAMKMLFDVN